MIQGICYALQTMLVHRVIVFIHLFFTVLKQDAVIFHNCIDLFNGLNTTTSLSVTFASSRNSDRFTLDLLNSVCTVLNKFSVSLVRHLCRGPLCATQGCSNKRGISQRSWAKTPLCLPSITAAPPDLNITIFSKSKSLSV